MFYRNHILISSSTADSTAIKDKFDHELAARNLSGAVKVITSPDLHESAESLVVVYPEGTYYHGVKVDDVSHIIEEHLLKGRFVKELLHREPEESAIPNLGDLDFFQKQKRLVLRRCGLIDPADIDDYIRTDGYQALARVLKSMAPAEVIAAVKKAGLRATAAPFSDRPEMDFVPGRAGKCDAMLMSDQCFHGSPVFWRRPSM